jgi:hypothetical protein
MKFLRSAKTWKWGLLFSIIFLFMAYIIIQYLIYSPKDAGLVSSKLKDAAFPYKPWVYILYLHIAGGSIAFVTGPFQFFRKPVGKKAGLHRKIGYAYVCSIIVASFAGAYLSYYATGGPIAGFGFLGLDIIWILVTVIALRKVFQKKFIEHQEWMLRSYAVTFAFVTFRILSILCMLIAHMPIQSATKICSWLCWILNLGIAEWMIYRKKKAKTAVKLKESYEVH